MQSSNGFRGLWYSIPQDDIWKWKYAGGFATYPQQHIPLAIYAPAAHKTFFCYGGALEGEAGRPRIGNMVSFFDHQTGEVARPALVLERNTDDAHYNPTLMIDGEGHITLFCNSHGQGYGLEAGDPTHGKAYIYRSDSPYSIEKFSLVTTDNFSYSQPWMLPNGECVWLHTRYAEKAAHRLFFSVAAACEVKIGAWSAARPLSEMGFGGYQISWMQGNRVATALDYHPLPAQDGLNARTNLYYLETRDGGRSWQNAAGHKLTLPLREVDNAALVHPFQNEGTLVYLKDIAFDGAGHPVILFISSRGPWTGPQSAPRAWNIARWTGQSWEIRALWSADHNYDHGSLTIEGENWTIVAPIEAGPQAGATGGAMSLRVSADAGQSWQIRTFPNDTARNQTYARKPLNAHPDFVAFWADGDAFSPSDSNLYFANRSGEVFRLPPHFEGASAFPERVSNPISP